MRSTARVRVGWRRSSGGRIRPLDRLRNALLILACILVLVPGELTAGWTPRVACVPLFLCLPPVLAAEKMRKVLGEEKRK